MKRAELLGPRQRTIPDILARQAKEFGTRQLLTMGSHSWTHAHALSHAAGRASTLLGMGICRGDRVALMMGNRAQFLECFLACGWIGAIAVPINTAAMGPQIQYYLANSQAKLLIIESDLLPRLSFMHEGVLNLREVWVLDAQEGLPQFKGVSVLAYPSWQEGVPAEAVQSGDPLAILYTSGTTGASKGVICSHAQYYWWGINSLYVLGVHQEDVLCTTLPVFHINALNTYVQAALAGCQVIYEPRFSASSFWPAMCRYKATVIYLLGTMVNILLSLQPGSLEREHKVRIGLGPGLPASAGEQFRDRTGILLLEGYGSTETNFAIATLPDSPRQGVMGWEVPGFEARVADPDDQELPIGQSGELLLRASDPFALSSGYFNMPEQTIAAWRNLWFHTGDRVVREADGALRFLDRIKDAIRRRGENISAFEVEQALLHYPNVVAVAVYPIPSELGEDDVMASLIAKPEIILDFAALSTWCQDHLPRFAIPRYFDQVQDLPRTENGKVQKYKLRLQGVTATTWERPT